MGIETCRLTNKRVDFSAASTFLLLLVQSGTDVIARVKYLIHRSVDDLETAIYHEFDGERETRRVVARGDDWSSYRDPEEEIPGVAYGLPGTSAWVAAMVIDPEEFEEAWTRCDRRQ